MLICLVIKHDLITTELLIRTIKLNISLVFFTQLYFADPKDSRLNSTHYFLMKIPNKSEKQQIDATTNQKNILEAKTIKGDVKSICKGIFDTIAKEKTVKQFTTSKNF